MVLLKHTFQMEDCFQGKLFHAGKRMCDDILYT